jgi:hypothetical protein
MLDYYRAAPLSAIWRRDSWQRHTPHCLIPRWPPRVGEVVAVGGLEDPWQSEVGFGWLPSSSVRSRRLETQPLVNVLEAPQSRIEELLDGAVVEFAHLDRLGLLKAGPKLPPSSEGPER